MAELFTAYIGKRDRLMCGSCHEWMRAIEILLENAHVKLVKCPHCWKLNKVKLE